ncbi:AEC family transporter [Pedobacter polaris]|uniref:AEC family transporter n=1 Tax=Pedobacter polaris TaxID=2571273 RepID=A0A4U1CT41_9SPHI|nr:AEC family transporter [Pedobacter polaris]TKC12311.1 AEC family transporter [Pedobacter polaris]
MSNFLLIFICIIAGIFFRKSGSLPKDAHKGINTWIINLGLPAISFKYLPHLDFKPELLFLALSPILVWAFGWLYITIYGASNKKISKATLGGLKLTALLSNTSFVGFALITAYFSEKEIGIAIICDQITFAILSTIGIFVAIRSSQDQKLEAKILIKKVITFPPIWGFVLALILPRFIDLSPLDQFFDKIAATVGPLALFSVGLQLKFGGWASEIKHISTALLYKLMLAPLLIGIVALLFGLKGMVPKIAIFEAAMPTLVTAGIVADQYNLNPKLSNLVVGVGIALSFISTGIWYVILTYLGLF